MSTKLPVNGFKRVNEQFRRKVFYSYYRIKLLYIISEYNNTYIEKYIIALGFVFGMHLC